MVVLLLAVWPERRWIDDVGLLAAGKTYYANYGKIRKKGVCTGNYDTNRRRLRDIPARINQNARPKMCRTLLFCFFSQSMIDDD